MSLVQGLMPIRRLGRPVIKHTWRIEWEGYPPQTLLSDGDGWKLPFTGELLREVKEGEIIPKWYGFAYYDFDTDVKYFLPLPLNWIVGAYRALRIILKFKVSDFFAGRHIQAAFQQGHRAGSNYDWNIRRLQVIAEQESIKRNHA